VWALPLIYVLVCSLQTGSNVSESPELVLGKLRGSVTIQCQPENCHYDPQRNYEMKYWCSWKEAGCSLVSDTSGFVQDAFEGRIRIISDDQENGTFIVVMSHLEEKDAGWYWCGAKNGDPEQTSSMKLHVQKGIPCVPLSSIMHTIPVTKSHLILVLYLSSSSASKLQLLPIVIPVIIVMLLLVCIIILTFIKVKLHKKKGKSKQQPSADGFCVVFSHVPWFSVFNTSKSLKTALCRNRHFVFSSMQPVTADAYTMNSPKETSLLFFLLFNLK
uniref:Ig-like domain-containing protein n=1 Tax=Gopherus agassizii TaxID=38772 RepID=A0A452HQX4_9SAUR